MRVLKTKRGQRQDKPLFSGNEAWCNQHNVVVVAGQPIGQWVVLEGCSINPVMTGSIKGHSCE